jgi:hypothetical protein
VPAGLIAGLIASAGNLALIFTLTDFTYRHSAWLALPLLAMIVLVTKENP